ncbi:Carotenoid oxygenase [Dillenia turbinata]|uniref:carotenoid 9,10-dioxygenase n=1 Tax=Dillenia turbinata TaxID=194707 RepID=A0AAN8ZD66_9MAGN
MNSSSTIVWLLGFKQCLRFCSMIHGMRIKDGKATYVSRFVKASRLKQEEYFGGSKFMKIGDLKGFFGLFMVHMQMLRAKMKVLDVSYGTGTGRVPENLVKLSFHDHEVPIVVYRGMLYLLCNTALVYHHGKLLALSEADKPFIITYIDSADVVEVLEDGELQTIGLLDYDKRLAQSFTAHPKVDPFTGNNPLTLDIKPGEMFTFGYSHTPPYITYRVISKDGVMQDPVPITVSEPIMMHDFAITESYAIFMDLPLYFRPKEMVKEKKLIFTFDATKKARFGVLPRYPKDELQIQWFELPNCFIFHNANAWEEEDEIVLITCRLENPDLDMVSGEVKEKLGTFSNELYEMRFNLKTGLASQKRLSASAVDFPRINESYTGRKQRYVYGTTLDSIAKVTGIIKFDLHAEPEIGTKLEVGGNVQGLFDLGPGRFGSEAVFVPREPGITSEEDDGYLIFLSHDDNTGKSAVNVTDAKAMSPDPVAVVELPHRVPYGFHAFFVTEIICVFPHKGFSFGEFFGGKETMRVRATECMEKPQQKQSASDNTLLDTPLWQFKIKGINKEPNLGTCSTNWGILGGKKRDSFDEKCGKFAALAIQDQGH